MGGWPAPALLPCRAFAWPCRAFELKWLLKQILLPQGHPVGRGTDHRLPKLSLPLPVLYLLLQTPDAILHLLDAFCAFSVQRFPAFTLHFFSATSKILCCWRRSLALPLVDCPHVAYPVPRLVERRTAVFAPVAAAAAACLPRPFACHGGILRYSSAGRGRGVNHVQSSR